MNEVNLSIGVDIPILAQERGKKFPLSWFNGVNKMADNKKEKSRSIKVKVNGKDVPLNPFATHILGNTIWAMISSLRLEQKPKRVEIELS